MSTKGLYATAIGTVGCALAIGFVMQETGDVPGRQMPTTLVPTPVEEATLFPNTDADSFDLDGISLTSARNAPDLADLLEPLQSEASYDLDKPTLDSSNSDAPHLACVVTATAAPAPMAAVELTIDAPCNRNQRVTIHHTGMMVTETTRTDGRLNVTFPALSETAVFIIEFEDGMGTVVTTSIPDLKDYDRVVLQWRGDNGFQIHAREFGAVYGSAGHVWSGAVTLTAQEGSGSVDRLGQAETLNPYLAEVYTFPSGTSHRDGTVALTVEAEVTQANCGRDIAAQTIQLHGGLAPHTQDLVLSMPDCSAQGDFLVLNNLLDDLKIAANK